MVITGSVILVQPGTEAHVREQIKRFPEITVHVSSESGTEIVVNFEADSMGSLEAICGTLSREIPQVVDITHIYVNFEEEVEKMSPTL